LELIAGPGPWQSRDKINHSSIIITALNKSRQKIMVASVASVAIF
jgi:hypothetical protein